MLTLAAHVAKAQSSINWVCFMTISTSCPIPPREASQWTKAGGMAPHARAAEVSATKALAQTRAPLPMNGFSATHKRSEI